MSYGILLEVLNEVRRAILDSVVISVIELRVLVLPKDFRALMDLIAEEELVLAVNISAEVLG